MCPMPAKQWSGTTGVLTTSGHADSNLMAGNVQIRIALGEYLPDAVIDSVDGRTVSMPRNLVGTSWTQFRDGNSWCFPRIQIIHSRQESGGGTKQHQGPISHVGTPH